MSVAFQSLKLAQGRIHTFTIDFLANTTYSRVLDSSVTTVDIEESIIAHHDSSSKQQETTDSSGQSLWVWSTLPCLVGHSLQLFPRILRV